MDFPQRELNLLYNSNYNHKTCWRNILFDDIMQQLRYILAHPFQTKITEITKNVRKNDKITENDKITKRQAEFKKKGLVKVHQNT